MLCAMIEFLKRLFSGGSNSRSYPNFGYAPRIAGGRDVREYSMGAYRAELMTDVRSTASVEYSHLLSVFGTDNEPVYFVAAEVNSMAAQFGGGSHYMGVFDGEGHASLQDSDEWADLESFAAEADRVAREHLRVDAADGT